MQLRDRDSISEMLGNARMQMFLLKLMHLESRMHCEADRDLLQQVVAHAWKDDRALQPDELLSSLNRIREQLRTIEEAQKTVRSDVETAAEELP